MVREKVLIKEAINLGLLATDEEVAEFIAKEKKQAEEDEEYAAGVNKIISAWGLSPEEYWDLYERYNVIRLLTISKLSRHVLKDYYTGEQITPETQQKMKQDWEEYVRGLLAKAKIDINPQYGYLGLSN